MPARGPFSERFKLHNHFKIYYYWYGDVQIKKASRSFFDYPISHFIALDALMRRYSNKSDLFEISASRVTYYFLSESDVNVYRGSTKDILGLVSNQYRLIL